MTLRQTIQKVQGIGERHGFVVAIVGGALVRNISKGVIIQRIDSKDKAIYLSHTENPGISREEDPKTTVDIDAIAFSQNKDPFNEKTRQQFSELQSALQKLQKTEKGFPAISIEPVFYHPAFPEPNSLFQFVSSVEMEKANTDKYIFKLGSITQEVAKESLEPWTYVFETGEKIASLMPSAIQRRYAIRGFTKKPKDKTKIWGEDSAFAQFVAEFNKQTHNQFEKYFAEWDNFEKTIQTSKEPLTATKRTLWNLYWKTIGTYLAHGTGLIGKILLPLGNTFFAGK